jgi:hypothetical protein
MFIELLPSNSSLFWPSGLRGNIYTHTHSEENPLYSLNFVKIRKIE